MPKTKAKMYDDENKLVDKLYRCYSVNVFGYLATISIPMIVKKNHHYIQYLLFLNQHFVTHFDFDRMMKSEITQPNIK